MYRRFRDNREDEIEDLANQLAMRIQWWNLSMKDVLRIVRSRAIRYALAHNKGRKNASARSLGLHPKSLYWALKKGI